MSRRAENLLDRSWNALDRGAAMRARSLARRALGSTREPALRAEARHLLGRIALQRGDPEKAAALLRRAVDEGGDWPDLFYDLGLALGDLGRWKEQREVFLEVLELDATLDDDAGSFDEDSLVRAAEETLEELPDEMLSRLRHVPILVDERPERRLVEEGFDPRALGLFDGPPYSEQGATGPALNRIVLYRANIAALAPDPEPARREVRITLLHETAHYFGLDEEQVAELGLA
jgi:predicted Zn-dependent protease with MMP-like domain